MTRRTFLQALNAPARPNLVLILSDQQHWRACGFQDPFFQTPHLDRLAAGGCIFDRAFCTTPQCSPSRSSIFTGWYPHRTGVYGNVGQLDVQPLRMRTIGADLRDAGYETGYFGKWHLGPEAIANEGWDAEARREDDHDATQQALAFLKKPRTKPFFLVVSYLDPHEIYKFRPGQDRATGPVELPPSWHRETFAKKPAVQREFMTADQGKLIEGQPQPVWEAYREFYRNKVKAVDAELGTVLDELRRQNLMDSTAIIASSDHGDMDTQHRLIFKGPFLYEHMVRIPLVVRVPGTRPRRVTDFDAVNTDIAPTLLDLAGLRPPERHGVSLRPLAEGKALENRPFVIGQYFSKQRWINPIRMIRTREFKYTRYLKYGEELYDLKNDPHELTNLAGDKGRARVQKALMAELENWMRRERDPFDTLKVTDRQGRVLS